jgi:hypothetical protein
MSKIDPILKLLFIGIVFFTLVLFAAEKWFTNDGQIFQVVSGLLTGFSGAFFMGIKKDLGLPDDTASTTVSKTVTTKVQETPKS